MHRFAIAIAILVLSAAALAQEPDRARFRSPSGELVVVPVVVIDRHGGFVAELPRDRFVLFDNGRRQALAFFSNADTPVSIALVIDISGSMRGKIGEVVVASLAFARSSHPEDELTIVGFNERIQDMLGGRHILAGDQADLTTALRSLSPEGRTALYDALMDGLDRLEQSSSTRHIVILVSDGGDNASRATLNQVLARARRSNVTMYTIGLFDANAADTNPDVLRELANATGGERFLPGSSGGLLAACERIAREIRSGYTLGVQPAAQDGAFHRIKVQLTGQGDQGLSIRARPGYVAGAPQ